jgi:hypothetical protein
MNQKIHKEYDVVVLTDQRAGTDRTGTVVQKESGSCRGFGFIR